VVPDGGNRTYTLSFRNKVNIVTAGGGAVLARDPRDPGSALVEIRLVIEGLIGEAWFGHVHWGPTAEGLLG
jgi:hypothetical protein